MKLFQISDLHLTSKDDFEYSFFVLKSLIQMATREDCSILLICGDLFDSFSELESLRNRFLTEIEEFPGKVFFLPGNHEVLRKGESTLQLSQLDWGKKVRILEKEPYSFWEEDGIEWVAIPHQTTYSSIFQHPLPAKTGKPRIGLAHGTITGASFTGWEEETEEGGSYLDPSLFPFLDLDYLAIGHLHRNRSLLLSGCQVVYAGSSRVWRQGEVGQRSGVLLQVENSLVHWKLLPIVDAGNYKEINLYVDYQGNLTNSWEDLLSQFHPMDRVLFRIMGVVEDSRHLEPLRQKLEALVPNSLRKIDSISLADLLVIGEKADNVFLRRFLEKCEQLKSSMEPKLWNQMKLSGLKMITEELK